MAIKKYGISVKCERCKYINADSSGGFDIDVPVCDCESGICGQARIHCSVTAGEHHVDLEEWRGVDPDSIAAPNDLQNRLSAMLDFVADHRLCGKRNLCPAEVIEFVKSRSNP